MTDPFNRQQRSTGSSGFDVVDAVAWTGREAVSDRSTFITRTYTHLFAAILAFVGLEVLWFKTGLALSITQAMIGRGSWLLVLGGFVLVSWLATAVAHRAISLPAQYLALAGYVLAQSLIFVPLLAIANAVAPGAISSAGLITLIGFTGLSFVAWGTRKDFSFLRAILLWGGVSVFLLILASLAFGFELGMFFSVAMVVFAGACILYDTSNVIHHYPEDRYVGAALSLFASFALMLWYVLRIFMSRR